jgi:hypothetical protein
VETERGCALPVVDPVELLDVYVLATPKSWLPWLTNLLLAL